MRFLIINALVCLCNGSVWFQHGQGTHFCANGDVYEGAWEGGKEHGKGKHTCANGDKYVGEYKDGQPNGYGTEMRPDGYRYVGAWEDGERVPGFGWGTIEMNKDELSCAICHDTEEDTDWCRGDCVHAFHLGCILKWRESCANKNRVLTCPMCRAKIEKVTRVVDKK